MPQTAAFTRYNDVPSHCSVSWRLISFMPEMAAKDTQPVKAVAARGYSILRFVWASLSNANVIALKALQVEYRGMNIEV